MAGEERECGCLMVGQCVFDGGDMKELLESIHGGSRKLEECMYILINLQKRVYNKKRGFKRIIRMVLV